MIELIVECSFCGARLHPRITLKGPEQTAMSGLQADIQARGWTVEFNGDHLDVYCSQRCSSGVKKP